MKENFFDVPPVDTESYEAPQESVEPDEEQVVPIEDVFDVIPEEKTESKIPSKKLGRFAKIGAMAALGIASLAGTDTKAEAADAQPQAINQVEKKVVTMEERIKTFRSVIDQMNLDLQNLGLKDVSIAPLSDEGIKDILTSGSIEFEIKQGDNVVSRFFDSANRIAKPGVGFDGLRENFRQVIFGLGAQGKLKLEKPPEVVIDQAAQKVMDAQGIILTSGVYQLNLTKSTSKIFSRIDLYDSGLNSKVEILKKSDQEVTLRVYEKAGAIKEYTIADGVFDENSEKVISK